MWIVGPAETAFKNLIIAVGSDGTIAYRIIGTDKPHLISHN